MAKGNEFKPLFAVQKGNKYNPGNLDSKPLDRRVLNGSELKLWDKEKIYFNSTKKQQLTLVVEDIKKDFSNKETYAPLILQLMCALGGVCHITTIAEMFLMYAGHRANKQDFIDGLNKLFDYSLVSTGKIAQGPRKNLQSMPVRNLEFVYVTLFGAIIAHGTVANNMQLVTTSTKIARVDNFKASIQSAMFISKLIKQNLLSNFIYHPIITKEVNRNGRKRKMLCRPMYSLNLKGCQALYYNCRKRDGWLKGIITELEKVSFMFWKKPPVIIIGAEDAYMTSDLYKAIMSKKRIKANILFTDDETQVKAKGKSLLYTFSVEGKKIVKKMM